MSFSSRNFFLPFHFPFSSFTLKYIMKTAESFYLWSRHIFSCNFFLHLKLWRVYLFVPFRYSFSNRIHPCYPFFYSCYKKNVMDTMWKSKSANKSQFFMCLKKSCSFAHWLPPPSHRAISILVNFVKSPRDSFLLKFILWKDIYFIVDLSCFFSLLVSLLIFLRCFRNIWS